MWPPKGFIKSKDGNTYAKIPTAKELVGLASNDKVLTRALAKKIDDVPVCEKFSCGAVQVASTTGCTWWVVTSTVKGVVSAEDQNTKGLWNCAHNLRRNRCKEVRNYFDN